MSDFLGPTEPFVLRVFPTHILVNSVTLGTRDDVLEKLRSHPFALEAKRFPVGGMLITGQNTRSVHTVVMPVAPIQEASKVIYNRHQNELDVSGAGKQDFNIRGRDSGLIILRGRVYGGAHEENPVGLPYVIIHGGRELDQSREKFSWNEPEKDSYFSILVGGLDRFSKTWVHDMHMNIRF